MEFGEKVLGLREEHLRATPAFVFHSQDDPDDQKLLFQARVLAFSKSTWTTHTSQLQEFLDFCGLRNYSPLECTPQIINLFILQAAQRGKLYGSIERFLSALSFLYKFLLISNSLEKEVMDIKQFMQKVCPHKSNKKDALGSLEIRKIWDSIDQKHKNVQSLNRTE